MTVSLGLFQWLNRMQVLLLHQSPRRSSEMKAHLQHTPEPFQMFVWTNQGNLDWTVLCTLVWQYFINDNMISEPVLRATKIDSITTYLTLVYCFSLQKEDNVRNRTSNGHSYPVSRSEPTNVYYTHQWKHINDLNRSSRYLFYSNLENFYRQLYLRARERTIAYSS